MRIPSIKHGVSVIAIVAYASGQWVRNPGPVGLIAGPEYRVMSESKPKL